jgi:hypothetical protein
VSELRRNALSRDVTSRLIRASHDELRVVDRLVTRLEHLRSLSWTRRLATGPGDVDRVFHLVACADGRVVTRCNGSWWIGDAVETSIDGPLLRELCRACVERWAHGKDIQLYGLLDLARDLATEDLARAALHEAADREMNGGGS